MLEAWAAGDIDRGVPAVILTDLKTRYTEQYPFSVFYSELHHALANDSLVVVGGYSFGDRPLNRALAHFLSHAAENRLIVWNPTGTRDAYLERLRKQLLDNDRDISADQIRVEAVRLPEAEAVRSLPTRQLARPAAGRRLVSRHGGQWLTRQGGRRSCVSSARG